MFDTLWVVFSILVQRYKNQMITTVTEETQWIIKEADQFVKTVRNPDHQKDVYKNLETKQLLLFKELADLFEKACEYLR